MKKLLPIIICALFSISVSGQAIRTDFDLSGFGVKINPDKRLIVVRTTLELAGINTELSEDGAVFRKRVLEDFRSFDPDLRSKLKIFVDQYQRRHPKKSPPEIASAFVSMAYVLSPTPNLSEPERSADLPGELLEVLDYSPLVREFYKSPGVAARIDSYFDLYQDQSSFLRPSAREMVRDVLDYLHTRPSLSYIERLRVEVPGDKKKKLVKIENVERFRSFTIVPDLLAAKGNINFLNIADTYIVVVPPGIDVSSSEVRRAYLQFVLDPMVYRETNEIFLHQIDIRSLLNERRKQNPGVSPDVVLATSRSLVAAADITEERFRKQRLATDQARRKIALMKTEDEKLAVSDELEKVTGELEDEALLRLSESYESGAVLVFYFAEKLRGSSESGFDISGSIRPWMIGLEPKKESGKYEAARAGSQRAVIARERKKTEKATTLVENPLTAELLKIDETVNSGRFDAAEKRLNELLEEYSENTFESARIYYSLGRMTSLSAEKDAKGEAIGEKLQKASGYYKSVLRTASPNDRALISSTYFALGRIYEHFDQNDYALKIYDAALRIGNVTGGAFEEAFEAKKALLAKKPTK